MTDHIIGKSGPLGLAQPVFGKLRAWHRRLLKNGD